MVGSVELADRALDSDAGKLSVISPPQPFDVSLNNEDIECLSSKLYGFPRRRKVSAIRDFPPGCGLNVARIHLKACCEVSKILALPCETVSKEMVTSDCVDDIVKKIDVPLSCKAVVTEIKTTGCHEAVALSIVKDSFDGGHIIERISEEKIKKAVNVGKESEEKAKVSAGLSKSNFHLQNDLENVEDPIICTSIFYGPPKRRKFSALRDYPPGCRPSTVTADRKQSVFVPDSSSLDNLENGKAGVIEETVGLLKRSESNKSPKRVLNVDSEWEDKLNGMHYSKQKLASKVSKGMGEDRQEKVVKSESGLVAKGVREPREVHDRTISENKMESPEQILDIKPLQVKIPPNGSKNIKKILEDERLLVKESNEKVTKDYAEKASTLVQLKEMTEHGVSVSNTLQIYAKGVYNIEEKTSLKKSVGQNFGKNSKGQIDRLSLKPDAVDHKKILSQQIGEVIDIGALGEKIIVLGLMAAPNCPWRHGRGSGASGNSSSRLVQKLRDRKMNRPDISNVPNPLEIVPVEYNDQLNLDDHLSSDDENEIGGSVRRNFSVNVPLEGLEPLNLSLGTEGEEVTRNRVRRTLRLFQVICRKLLQDEESKIKVGRKGRRIDLDAAAILKEKNQCVNTGKAILGHVPGVEIGDEFHFRAELSVVGLHRPYQGGIDYLKIGDTVIATSIVAGGNENEMEGSDILIYSGSGGSAGTDGKPPEDQKLERGNLSLKNSIEAQKPVRVIRGSKELKTDSRDGKAKPVTTYVYDGLYIVEKYWKEKVQQGYFAFKFQLRRIGGQPELPIKVIKKSGKPLSRSGVCIKDISDGKEGKPICVVNTIDDERPRSFKYITKIRYPSSCVHAPPRGCECTDGCSDSDKCACAVKNGGEIPFTYSGAIVQAKPLVYECGPSCKCPASCHNRVGQHGIKIQLEVFKTESRGWGVRSLSSIASGSFVCEYVGELLPDDEAEQRSNDEYLFDLGNNYDDATLWEGLPTSMLPSNGSEHVEDSGFTIDAARYGNVGRFINHSCSPNLYAQNVLYDHDDHKMPHIMFFAAENIPPLQELAYHYNYTIGQVQDSDGNEKSKDCHCGSQECSGRLY